MAHTGTTPCGNGIAVCCGIVVVVAGRQPRGDRNGAVVDVHVSTVGGSFALLPLGRVTGFRVGRGGGGDLERAVDRHRDGGHGAGAGGGDDGGLGVFEEPTDGFAVGFVAELASELKDPRRTRGGHSDPPASTLYFGMTARFCGWVWAWAWTWARALDMDMDIPAGTCTATGITRIPDPSSVSGSSFGPLGSPNLRSTSPEASSAIT
ncbi:hypothetical protein CR513_53457, partial [Mucuna pruriens]